MEVDGGATTITELPDLNPESIQIKPEFLDETDHVGFEDCKKEFGLENVPVSTELTNKETKHEGDWDMLEAEICEELIIKDEDEDISDINLALYSEDKTSKAGVLGANAYIDSLSAVSPKKEKIADQNAAGGHATTGASPSMNPMSTYKFDDFAFSTVSAFGMDRHQAHNSSESSKNGNTSIMNSLLFSPLDNILNGIGEERLFRCLYPGCTFYTFNQRAFRCHHHGTNEKATSKLMKCKHCTVVLSRPRLLKHILNTHKDQIEKCLKCSQQVPCQLMRYHSCGKSSYKKYSCKLCTFVTTQKISFIKHMKFHENKPPSAKCTNSSTREQKNHSNKLLTDTYNCYHCSYSSNRRCSFVKHTMNHSKHLPIIKCKKCDYRSVKQLVGHHYFKEHFDVKSQSGKLYKCDLCALTISLRQKKLIEKHINEHADDLLVVKCHIDECDFTSLRYIVAVHYTQTHATDYACKICSYTTIRIDEYTKHCHKHDEKKKEIFKCRVCLFSSGSQITLKQHMVDHTIKANNSLSCLYCPQHVKGVTGLIVHSTQSHPENNQKCSGGLHTVPAVLMRWHVQNCRSLGNETYNCQECSYSTSKKGDFEAHRKAHLNSISLKQCPYCDYRSTYRALNYHIKMNHFRKVEITSTFKCAICSYRTRNSKQFKQHRKYHLRDILIRQCPHCDYKSSNRALWAHVKAVHNVALERKTFKCDECSFITRSRRDLIQHQQGHLKGYQIMQCPRCDYTSTNKALIYHLRYIHCEFAGSGKYPNTFYCKFCSYSTFVAYALKNHERAHTTNHIHQCPYCDYKSMRVALRFHINRDHPQEVKREKKPEVSKSRVSRSTINISKNDGVKMSRDELEPRGQKMCFIKVEPPEEFQCVHCPYVGVGYVAINAHLRKSHKQYNVSCQYCNRSIPKQLEQTHIESKCLKRPRMLTKRKSDIN